MDTALLDGTIGATAYKTLRMPEEAEDLIVLLHGAFSSADRLVQLRPMIEGMWADGTLPPCVLACASTPTVGGFYIGEWETLVAKTLPEEIGRRFGTTRVSLLGASMGGYGALKIAFADPARWTAVAATSPALLNDTPGPRNTISVLAALRDTMTAAGWERESALHRLRRHADEIRAARLPIMLRCGDRDAFALHDGTERLHRELWDLDIAHDYHLVRDADHAGPEAADSTRAALTFLAASMRAPADDPEDVTALRAMIAPDRAEAARRDPDTGRRYARL
ncbi:alpha/beta hydrolase-fold protein [Catenuloplanes japonicus]|uniref:alpha/beta hydrolase-fold protein n=1 Tax=Catenuloplanes japonicus TaxID=33876 RepID=UPI00068CA76F|nr:alpha/beta hydrolase-fold protein [Catenuloplanes japonicus]